MTDWLSSKPQPLVAAKWTGSRATRVELREPGGSRNLRRSPCGRMLACGRTLTLGGIDTLHTSLVHHDPRTGPGGAERPWLSQVESHDHSVVGGVLGGVCGHGIGRRFHDPPNVMLFGRPGEPGLQPGMLFTIEPMVNAGRPRMNVPDDRWTAVTCDPADLSAQFEHMVGVTKAGVATCTLSPAYFDRPPPQK